MNTILFDKNKTRMSTRTKLMRRQRRWGRRRENKKGEEFKGIISGITDWGLYVELEENKCEGMVRIREIKDDYYTFDEKQYALVGETTKNLYQLGDNVLVKVKNADLIKRHLDFDLLGKIEED